MPTAVGREDVRRLLAEGAQLVEVLPPEDYEREHITGAINLPLKELSRELGNARTPWKAFFREDQDRQECHRRDIHYSQRKKKYEERPVTSQAIDAVLQSRPKGIRVPFPPGVEDEILRCAAFRQADTFEGCQLVNSSQRKDATADLNRVHHDPGNLLGQLRCGEGTDVFGDTCCDPSL